MPLFVSILRHAMLFLNIYDSYKVLKTPPPSVRHGGQPSQRALSQRKRDMKGCLAVWIVWCCFMTYERFAEAIVSLFVPFYDEFKSLAILFLILTRARGAEPIFLHILRPLLKPYTPTLDILLDFVCMIGDMIFALLTLPIRVILSWWKKSIFHREATLEPKIESLPVERNNTPPDFPRKVSSDPTRFGFVRNSSNGSTQNAIQADRWVPKGKVQRVPSNGIPNGLQSHHIWHPPRSSYSDDDEEPPDSTPNTRPRHELVKDLDLQQPAEVDEWRQYPPFPSAYPPTPIATTSSGLPTNPSHPPRRLQDTTLTEISEDEPPQDFRGSLLPLRKPLNPSYVGLSDDHLTNTGVQSDLFDDKMAVDTDSEITDMDDEEDAFNITLRTPIPALRSARSQVRDITPVQRPVSFASSAASKSTALTTAGGGSSLRTRSSSESLSSVAVSIISATDSSSLIGNKRPLSRDIVVGIKNKVQLVNRPVMGTPPRRRGILNMPARHLPHTRKTSQRERVFGGNSTVGEDTSSSVGDADVQKDHTTKRRKIALPPGHATPSSHLVRRRIMRHATRPGSASKSTTARAPFVVSRPSARVRPGVSAQFSSPSSSNDHAPEPTTQDHGQSTTTVN